MEKTQALKWAGVYLATWIAATVVGGAIAAAGVALGGLAPVGLGAYEPASLQFGVAYPRAGLAVLVLGVLAWKFGTALALIRTLTLSIESETAAQLNTETLKSDILSVLDDRLADMHQEVEETRRLVDRLGREEAASEFEFQGVDQD